MEVKVDSVRGVKIFHITSGGVMLLETLESPSPNSEVWRKYRIDNTGTYLLDELTLVDGMVVK